MKPDTISDNHFFENIQWGSTHNLKRKVFPLLDVLIARKFLLISNWNAFRKASTYQFLSYSQVPWRIHPFPSTFKCSLSDLFSKPLEALGLLQTEYKLVIEIHIHDAVSKMASETLGCMNRITASKLWEIIVPAYSVLSYPTSNIVGMVHILRSPTWHRTWLSKRSLVSNGVCSATVRVNRFDVI